MEHEANFSINHGPNWDDVPTTAACRSLGLLLAELVAGFEPPNAGTDLTTQVGDEWQYYGEEVCFVVEAAAFPGTMYWVYPSGMCLVTNMAEQSTTYFLNICQ